MIEYDFNTLKTDELLLDILILSDIMNKSL